MSQELIYTSSPRGLKLGARGFCTVASTPGMAKNLADRLESLSGYRHLYSPGSPEAHLNPVNYSYVRFAMAGQTHYLLSRIADAGLDYTQRTNKLAHHIALQQSEVPAAGPAWLALQPNVFEMTWNRDPALLPTNRRPMPQGTLNADVCSAWKTAAGDAGWAGALAEQILKHPTSEAYLIYSPGTDVLELFMEAQSLLTPEQRWEATFSTYFTSLPPGMECRWRAVVDGSPEALRARRSPNSLVIDLTVAPGQAPDSALVEVARCGAQSAPIAIVSSTHSDGVTHAVEQVVIKKMPHGWDPIGRGSDAPVSISQPPALPRPRSDAANSQHAGSGLSRRERAAWLTTIVVLIMACIGLAYYFTRPVLDIPEPIVAKANPESVETSPKNGEHQPRNQPKAQPYSQTPPQLEKEEADIAVSPPNSSDDKPGITVQQSSASPPKHNEPSPPPTELQVQPKQVKWNDTLESGGFRNEVSLPVVSKSLTNEKWMQPIVLASFLAKPNIELSLITTRMDKHAAELVMIPSMSHDEWDILFKRQNGDSDPPLATIGFFDGDDNHLKFRWAENAKDLDFAVELLRDSVLRLRLAETNSEQPLVISFRAIIRRDAPFKWNKDWSIKLNQQHVFQLTRDSQDTISIPNGQSSFASLRITNTQPDQSTIPAGESSTFAIGKPRVGQIKLTYIVSVERRPSIVVQVLDPQDGKSTFHDWFTDKSKSRKKLLETAILSYINSPEFVMYLPRLSHDLGFPLDPKAFLTELSKQELSKVSQFEQNVRKTLATYLPKDAVQIAKSKELEDDEERWPELYTMDKKLSDLLNASEIHLKISRRIECIDKNANAVVEVFVAGHN